MSMTLAFYADDFTGATDALEQLTLAGLRTVLFTDPPSRTQLARFKRIDAFGVAGMTRAMAPGEMERTLRPAFEALKRFHPRHVHYKVCSTFDSSPRVGSIGRALDVGVRVFRSPFVPLLVAAPALGRYCVFGNLFARMGIGSAGEIHRLDRHASMSRHPVTPMREADLRIHLAQQTKKRIDLVNVLALEGSLGESWNALYEALDRGAQVVLFDGVNNGHLRRVGELIDKLAMHTTPLFSVGSSGIEMALCAHWSRVRKSRRRSAIPIARKARQILVGSGSCSPVTLAQIDWARRMGFAEVPIGVPALGSCRRMAELKRATTLAAKFLSSGRSVIVHTNARGPKRRSSGQSGKLLGESLGQVLRGALARVNVPRICVTGGDTSSFAARALGIEALEMIARLTPGAPLCRAHAPGSPADGCEFVFKGGQVGAEDYFEMLYGN